MHTQQKVGQNTYTNMKNSCQAALGLQFAFFNCKPIIVYGLLLQIKNE